MVFSLTVLLYMFCLGLSFLCEAGIVWLICWCLKAIGIVTIFGWTVAFSWPLVLVVWIISWFLGGKRMRVHVDKG